MTYEPVIGLEIHAQLKTKSKMFCGCPNGPQTDAEVNAELRGMGAPNTRTCPVCLGMPGTLPVANRQALEWTFLLGLALGAKVADQFNFERKQYFYPDLPKAYQITSQTTPPLIGGSLEIESKVFSIEHIHLEEDAGKLVHTDSRGSGADNRGYSLVDLNRAGTPLLEIVTDPTFSTPAEAKSFMQELRLILRYLDISDADMEKGHMRADANISIRPKGEKKLGKKTEVKNLNSFMAVERALEFEINRQTDILEGGGEVKQETRGWDENKGTTFGQRSKEYANDYRYFPEPDLPPFHVGNKKLETKDKKNGVPSEQIFDLDELKRQIPELPQAKRERYQKDYGLTQKDAETLVGSVEVMRFFENAVDAPDLKPETIKKISNWVIGPIIGYLNENNKGIADLKADPKALQEMAILVESGELTSTIAKDLIPKLLETGMSPKDIIEREGIRQVSDEGELEEIIQKVIDANAGPVADFKAGKEVALKFLIGQVMKETKGQADPVKTGDLLGKLLQK